MSAPAACHAACHNAKAIRLLQAHPSNGWCNLQYNASQSPKDALMEVLEELELLLEELELTLTGTFDDPTANASADVQSPRLKARYRR